MATTPLHPGRPPRPDAWRARAVRATLTRAARFAAAGAGLTLALATFAGAAPPLLRPPRDPAQIRFVTGQGPHAGECDRCHTTHAGEQLVPQPNILQSPDDNSLCTGCHTQAWQGGSFAGPALYAGSPHGGGVAMVWPGPVPPPRIEPDAPGKCLNCHDPHGFEDAAGLVPSLELAREEKLCLTCHDGSPATTDVASDLLKPSRHPIADYEGRHTGALESSPADFAAAPLNRRHAECEDCHNAHVSRADPSTGPAGTDASKTTLGVSRVAVLNGPADSPPLYTFIAGSDTLTGPPAEHELCFKCHSSWTTQPTGQPDLARELNPNNPSYHPVEAAGNDLSVNPQSFAGGWSSTSVTRCSDCHGSDFGSTRGPHGSAYAGLLRHPSPASSNPRMITSDELCFQCHRYDVYADPGSLPALRAASRFNAPGVAEGHAEHVGNGHVPCYACHVTHGSGRNLALLVTGRSPGMVSVTTTAGGGSCTSTCHEPQTWTVNYAR